MDNEFTPINTQEEFDARVQKVHGDVTGLRSQIETLTGDLAARDNTIGELNGKVKAYQLKELRAGIGKQKGIRADMLDRLTGEDEKTIAADADRLYNQLKAYKGLAPLHNPEPPNVDPKTAGVRDLLCELRGE